MSLIILKFYCNSQGKGSGNEDNTKRRCLPSPLTLVDRHDVVTTKYRPTGLTDRDVCRDIRKLPMSPPYVRIVCREVRTLSKK